MRFTRFIKNNRRLCLRIGIACVVVIGGGIFAAQRLKLLPSGSNSESSETTQEVSSEDNETTDITEPTDIGEPTKPTDTSEDTSGEAQSLQNIDKAVSIAVLNRGKNYLPGEAAAEGHVILKQEEADGVTTVYAVCSFRWFGFENGIFNGVSGSGNIPTVIKLEKSQTGDYSLLDYQEPMDGSLYTESIKKMFPKDLWNKVLTINDNYPEIGQQMKEQAEKYLQSIGRTAEVSVNYVEKTLVDINTDASNTLFAEMTKNNSELNLFPYWIGTKEYVLGGIRYIYETTQSKAKDEKDLVLFRKYLEDGTLVLEYKYKILGKEPKQVGSIIYDNKEYGFTFSLPLSWKGYKIITDKWQGMAFATNGEKPVETGPLLYIRHPKWTKKIPRQDIPIMIFTIEQWNKMQQDKFHIGAAPINPSELSRNTEYVFALPARYNYAFPKGFEEVEEIIEEKSLLAR